MGFLQGLIDFITGRKKEEAPAAPAAAPVVEKAPEPEPAPAPEPEPVAEAPAPEPEAATGKRRGVGVIRANEAINCLAGIPKNDRLRERGLQIVADWIEANGRAGHRAVNPEAVVEEARKGINKIRHFVRKSAFGVPAQRETMLRRLEVARDYVKQAKQYVC